MLDCSTIGEIFEGLTGSTVGLVDIISTLCSPPHPVRVRASNLKLSQRKAVASDQIVAEEVAPVIEPAVFSTALRGVRVDRVRVGSIRASQVRSIFPYAALTNQFIQIYLKNFITIIF